MVHEERRVIDWCLLDRNVCNPSFHVNVGMRGRSREACRSCHSKSERETKEGGRSGGRLLLVHDIIFLIGRILLVLVFIGSGINHLTNDALVGYAQYKKIPNAALAVRLSGVLMLTGALGIVCGVWGDLAALLSALLVLLMTIPMHNYWTLDDPMAKQTDQIMFMKNISIIGGLLAVAWAFSTVGEGGYTITNSVF